MYEHQPIDYITVCSKLTAQGKLDQVGGQEFILDLSEDQASSANVYHYGKIVKEKSVVRNIVKEAMQVSAEGELTNWNENGCYIRFKSGPVRIKGKVKVSFDYSGREFVDEGVVCSRTADSSGIGVIFVGPVKKTSYNFDWKQLYSQLFDQGHVPEYIL